MDLTSTPLVSADAHVDEPHDLWFDRLPAGMRERAPRRLATDDDGGWSLVVDGADLGWVGISPADAADEEARRWSHATPEHRIEIDEIWVSPPVAFDTGCVDAVRGAARLLGYDHMDMVSGAGHDAVYVSRVAPTAMIFVPCEGGISHNEIENATKDDLEAGCNVLLHAMLERASA